MNLNSYYYPVTLHIPQNILIARPPPPTNTTPTRILNLIPPENLEKFIIDFFETNSTQLNKLTSLLDNHNHLTPDEWEETCIILDDIVEKNLVSIEKTCKAAPIPTLTNKTSQQGGFLPQKLSKKWKNTSTHTILLEKQYTLQKTTHIGKFTPS